MIHSAKHVSEISERWSRGTVVVGHLYADEEKEFLVDIFVPQDESRMMHLLDIMCSNIDVLSDVRVKLEFVEIRRPSVPSPCDVKVKLEVDRQRNRLDAVDGLAEAQRVAKTGDLEGTHAILLKKISSIRASMSGQASDGLTLQLQIEMKET
ncbi:hypothetical protein CASFOL_003083 [Castilleja foliolosa]|uniref:Uncharacterized protein n=1 Tax=Castilleja foliolosa TaxID=1961234 RepID=A0ABD3EG53_9LAMI